MHCKIVFNFALRHDLAFLQDIKPLIGLGILIPIGQWAESWLIEWLPYVNYIMVADSQRS